MEVTADITQLVCKPISCFVFSPNGIAICTNDENVKMFVKEGNIWKEETTLYGHDQIVTGMDWFYEPKIGDRLITVSADRNGYVWTKLPNSSEWTQSLVALRLRRAATSVKWTKDGRKFAVGGSEGICSIGYYEPENDWWVCKHLKCLDGPVIALDWHPNGIHLAISTLSGNISVVSTMIKGVDQNVNQPNWCQSNTSTQNNFDQVIRSFKIECWIHSVSFSPSGDYLALAGHDGKLYIMNLLSNQETTVDSPKKLPLRRVCFISESSIAASGFGNLSPFIAFKSRGDSWSIGGNLQEISKSKNANPSSTTKAFGGALAKFQALDKQGIKVDKSDTFNPNIGRGNEFHQCGISDIFYEKDCLFTGGFDGKLISWDLCSLLNRLNVSNL